MNSGTRNRQESPYQGLLYSIFQQPRVSGENSPDRNPDKGQDRGMVVAITSAVLGAGVSQVSRNIGLELGNRSSGRILEIDLTHLQGSPSPTPATTQLVPVASAPSANSSSANGSSNIFRLRSTPAGASATGVGVVPDGWQRSVDYRKECVTSWRSSFEYTLIDCPPLLASGDALSVARLVDGYLVVVEANQTRAKQIDYVESQIELAGGTLLGFVLNKRKYLIPEFIFRHL